MLEKYPTDLIERAKKIKVLVMDVDGVLSDGRFIYGNYGDELKNFDVNDGMGVFLVRQSGIKTVILTAKASRVVRKRAKEMKVDKVYENFHFKAGALEKIKKRFRVDDDQVCFIGDDVIDVPVLKKAGLAVCPCNAMDEVKPFAHFITEKGGGRGAVREVCNFILRAQGTWDYVTRRYFND